MKTRTLAKLLLIGFACSLLIAAAQQGPDIFPSQIGIPVFRYPVVGIGEGVTYDLGSLRHSGADQYAIDFSYDEEGIDVYPTLPGRVVFVGYEKDYGWTVVLRHWDAEKWDKVYYSIYAHLTGSDLPELWSVVDGNLPIGIMGKSGNGSNGVVHLHFAVRASDQVYDGLVALFGKQGFSIVTPAFDICPSRRDSSRTECYLY